MACSLISIWASRPGLQRHWSWCGLVPWPERDIESPGARQYLLIAQEERQIEVYEWHDSGWSYRVLRSADATVEFAVGDARMTVAEIYEDTSLDPKRADAVAR